MLIEIDFNSDEALYVQLQNQIIMGCYCDNFSSANEADDTDFLLRSI